MASFADIRNAMRQGERGIYTVRRDSEHPAIFDTEVRNLIVEAARLGHKALPHMDRLRANQSMDSLTIIVSGQGAGFSGRETVSSKHGR